MQPIIKMKVEDIIIVIVSILLFQLSFVKILTRYFPNYIRVQQLATFVLLLYAILNYRVFANFKYILYNVVVICLAISMTISMMMNRYIQQIPIQSCLIHIVEYILPLIIFECLHESKKMFLAVKTLYGCSLFYCVITDIHAILTNAKYVGVIGTYLVGNKFHLSYLHMFMLVLFFYLWLYEGRTYFSLVAHFVYAIVVAFLCECTTALIGCLLLFAIFVFRNTFKLFSKKLNIVYITLIISDSILLIFSEIVYWKPIRFVIEEVLHEDVTLTGRMNGFKRIFGALAVNPIWGVGYENNYYISKLFSRMDDLQNGLADLMLSYGIVGVFLVMLLVGFCVHYSNKQQSYGFTAMMYVFIILSSVEVTLNLKFVMVLVLVAFAWDKEKEDYDFPKPGSRKFIDFTFE